MNTAGSLIAVLFAVIIGADDLLVLLLPVGGVRLYRRYFRSAAVGSSVVSCLLDGVGDRSLVGKADAIVHEAHLRLDQAGFIRRG
jgi:hypothetical protein